jgi:hypothetical protein
MNKLKLSAITINSKRLRGRREGGNDMEGGGRGDRGPRDVRVRGGVRLGKEQ